MKYEQVQEAIAPHLPEIITGAANTFFTALIFGSAAFMWWLVKRRIEKKEVKEDERGPELYKKEHDEYCKAVEEERSSNVDDVLEAIKEVKDDQKRGFKDMDRKLSNVHRRVDSILLARGVKS